MECIRTCPHDNIALNVRLFSADLAKPSTRMDEAFKAFIMFGSAMIYAGVLLGPNSKGRGIQHWRSSWFVYAAAFLAVIFVSFQAYSLLEFFELKTNCLSGSALHRFQQPHTAGLDVLGCFQLILRADKRIYIIASLSDPLGLGSLRNCKQHGGQCSPYPGTSTDAALVGGLIWSAAQHRKHE
jgi:hypothetical protein